MKITVETTTGGAYNSGADAWEQYDALLVTSQASKGTKTRSVSFAFDGAEPAKMLRAAAAYFEAQEPF